MLEWTLRPEARKASGRRQPQQRRARQTVEALLDAVIRILKRDGSPAVTTNRIAEVAGVSIGSVYQYFPHKRAIFEALHRRHLEQIDRLIQDTIVEHAESSLDELVRALIEAMVEAHLCDPELYALMYAEVPHRAGGSQAFAQRLHGVFFLSIASRKHLLKRHTDPAKVAFVVANMVDALSHAAALQRPSGLSLASAKEEAIRAVLAYLHA